MMTQIQRCGCETEVDRETQVIRSVHKCRRHKARYLDPQGLGKDYYRSLGSILDSGEIRTENYLREIAETLGGFPTEFAGRTALEIGCGISPYAGALTLAGWRYVGLDPSPWAVEYTGSYWRVAGVVGTWEDYTPPANLGLILSAHSLEHMEHAPNAVQKMAAALRPSGELWLVVPDDTDLCNPDHLWFFNAATLRATVERAGLTVLALESRSRVAHENFLYLRAVRD